MTRQILLDGWEPGIRKISLNHLLQEEGGMSLSEAKKVVDNLLSGQDVQIEIASDSQARHFLQEARKLGATGILR